MACPAEARSGRLTQIPSIQVDHQARTATQITHGGAPAKLTAATTAAPGTCLSIALTFVLPHFAPLPDSPVPPSPRYFDQIESGLESALSRWS